jgi:phage shock protein PspC (stress-responsive transcriptional regulator)
MWWLFAVACALCFVVGIIVGIVAALMPPREEANN